MEAEKSLKNASLPKIKAKYLEMLTGGKNLPAVLPNFDPQKPPPWFEPDAFKHAQQLFKTYGSLLILSELFGMLLLLMNYKGLAPIISTGNSSTFKLIFVRYLSMFSHIAKWYRYDPFDPSSEAYRSIKEVRRFHAQACAKVNQAAGLQHSGSDELWMNQHSMGGTQFGFVGMITLFPKQFGFHNFTPKDFHSIYHFWRVLGYCLGIDDRYNFCGVLDEDMSQVCTVAYYRNILPKVCRFDPIGSEMDKTICMSWYTNPLVSYNILFRYFAPCMNMKRSQFQLSGLSEKLCYKIFKFVLQHATKSVTFTWLLTVVQQFVFRMIVKLSPLLEWYFDRKYRDVQFNVDPRCPFKVRINYKPIFK